MGKFLIDFRDGNCALHPTRNTQMDIEGTHFLSVTDPTAPVYLQMKGVEWTDDPSEPDPMQGTRQYHLGLHNNTDFNVYDPWLIFVELGAKEYLNPHGITSRAYVNPDDPSYASKPYVDFSNVDGYIEAHGTVDAYCDVFFPKEVNKKLLPIIFVAYGSWPGDYIDVGEGYPDTKAWRETYDAAGGRGIVGSASATVENGEYFGWVQHFVKTGAPSGSIRLSPNGATAVYLPQDWENDFSSRPEAGWATGPIEFTPPSWAPFDTEYAYLPVEHLVFDSGWIVKHLGGNHENEFILCNNQYFVKWQIPGVHSEYIGLPVADVDGPYTGLDDVAGNVQEFEGGEIISYPGPPIGFAYAVNIWGPIYNFWDTAGRNESVYGWPIQDAVYHPDTGYYDQEFQNGTITWDPASGETWDGSGDEMDFGFPVAYPGAEGYYNTQVWMTFMAPYGYHLGDDWDVIGGLYDDYGDPFYTTEAGEVIMVHNFTTSWWNVIAIRHDNVPDIGTVTSIYAHCKDVNVIEGQLVDAGELIGTIGDANGLLQPHLHFEIRIGTDTTMEKSHNPTIVELGPQGQVDPTEFVNNH